MGATARAACSITSATTSALETVTAFPTLADTGIDYVHTTEYRSLEPAFADGGKTLAAPAKQYCKLSVIVNGSLDDPRDAPTRVRTGQPLSADVPASLLGPVADVKDWEIAGSEALPTADPRRRSAHRHPEEI
jgi:hypothetical protein